MTECIHILEQHEWNLQVCKLISFVLFVYYTYPYPRMLYNQYMTDLKEEIPMTRQQ
jgi:hypothetical protein